MKRYFIFGFLTILIITLNFAFIIALTKDDVRINYNVLFLLWLVVILAAAGLAYLERSRNKKAASAGLQEKIVPEDPLKPTAEEVSPTPIYKHKSIIKFKMHLSDDLTTKLEPGFFGGYIQNEEYSNEVVQAVYTKEEQLLGYINKKEEQLCHNLETLYKEPVACWGHIVWSEDEKSFTAKVHVPILYSEPEVNRFKKLIQLKTDLLRFENTPEALDLEAYLEKAEHFNFVRKSQITPSSLDYKIDNEILVSLSRQLVESKEWQKVQDLEKYPLLIHRLEQPYRKEVQAAIKKGKKKLDQQA